MKCPVIIVAALTAVLVGCTSVDVRPVSSKEQISQVVIRKNPKVAVADFLDVLISGFQRHGIATRVISDDAELKDEYVVNYVAYRNWDMAPYLTDATISIDRNGRRVAEGQYHLKGKGGLSLMKWQGTKTKMDPVIDQMLSGLVPRSDVAVEKTDNISADLRTNEDKAPDLYTELTKLDELRKKGVITEEEFAAQKKRLFEKQ
jgi:hypothetical protein